MTETSTQDDRQIFESFLGPTSMGWEVVPQDDALVIALKNAWGKPVADDAEGTNFRLLVLP